ncbi:hypothetical protein LMG23992_00375 [Cupriavidus laharis]|uniref:Uncharacterized protein n=1 Tax=Cupriavidus laharis TaxID=151654 RepID=A0ABM8WD80_9BURK|nr:hypothetical protein [Cupriavidus laharis]CAG9165231.1 hypothetical protein LMG23992_00375 [Cupriavidus laharis]
MAEAAIDEKELQNWLTPKAAQGGFLRCIAHLGDLHDAEERLRLAQRENLKPSLAAVQRAIRVCHMLADAELLTADKSVAPYGSAHMRPDLTLRSTSGNFMLVELKSKEGAERQGVQELLAYSAVLRLQQPHANEIVYIVVARHWDALLRFSVLSLMMDGKYVLPLRCYRQGDTDFDLEVAMELFDFDSNPFYSPMYALKPQVLAVTHDSGNKKLKWNMKVYFEDLARDSVAQCRKIGQSGFALVWSNPSAQGENINLTLATVNQNWRNSEHTPSDVRILGEKPTRLDDVISRQAAVVRRAALKRVKSLGRKPDVLDRADASEETLRLYADSEQAGEILDMFRNLEHETTLEDQSACWSRFEPSSVQNLWAFLHLLRNSATEGRLIKFLPFGDLEDYVRAGEAGGDRQRPKELCDFYALMKCFEQHKRNKLLPDEEEASTS